MASVDTIKVKFSGDLYAGGAQFGVSLDGFQRFIVTTLASHSQNQTETFSVSGDFTNVHQVSFALINDAYDGPGKDRNLYIESVEFDGINQMGSNAIFNSGLKFGNAAELTKPSQLAIFNVNGYNNNDKIGYTDDGTGFFKGTSLPNVAQAQIKFTNDTQLSQVYRFFDTHTGDHFYTNSAAEKAEIQKTIPYFNFEGSSWSTPDASASTHDVFRFFDTKTGTHFFTDNVNERDTIRASLPNYTYEGVAFEAYNDANGAGHITLERFFNTQTGQHHFAGNAEEAASINQGKQGSGWIDEGKAFTVHMPSDGVLIT